jgi:phosphatidylinositol-bisphosphatase
VFVEDISLVRSLNDNKSHLDDVLVLRVKDGRDHFIPIRGTWLQSCFGRSIEELIHVPEGGVRALLPHPKSDGPPINRGQEVRWSAPRELFKLTEAVEAITERVVADAGILSASQIPEEAAGWPFDLNSWLLKDSRTREHHKVCVLNALDTDKNLNESFPTELPTIERLEIMAEVLILWLKSLTDGIVPESLWSKIDADIVVRGAKQLTDAEETKAWVLDVLSASPNHNISFVFLTSMLSRVANEIAPLPKTGWKQSIKHKATGSFDSVRRSLSWKGKAPQFSQNDDDAVVERRISVERAYAETFGGIVFRGSVAMKEGSKEKRIVDERRRYIIESFLHGSQTSTK